MPGHVYPGVDPLPPPPDSPGAGVWVWIQVPDDGDDRDAASVAAGLEGLADRTNWIRWRMVDGLSGGFYNAPLSFTNLQSIGNAQAPIMVIASLDASGQDIKCANLTASASVTANAGELQYLAVQHTISTANLTFTAFSSTMAGLVQDATTKTRSGQTIKNGNNAWEGQRVLTVDVSGSNVIDPKTFDRAVVPGVVPATVTITIANPPAGVFLPPIPFSRRNVGAQGHHVIFIGSSGGIATLTATGASNVGYFTLNWDGTGWYASDLSPVGVSVP